MEDPQSFLVEPGEPEASMTNGFANPLDLLNYLSPTAYLDKLIDAFLHVDVIGWAMECLTGDWQALWKFGDAMGNLGRAMQAIGTNIQAAALRADESWHGNAADAAYTYFSDLAAATSGQQTGMFNAENGYHQAARGAWQLAGQLGNVLQAIGDQLIMAAIAGAAGTVTAESGVGVVVGWGMAALFVQRAFTLVTKASQIINTAGTVVLGGFGGVMEATAQVNHLSEIPLPAAAFAVPGA